MDNVICRCGTHLRIKQGIKTAVQMAGKGGLSNHDNIHFTPRVLKGHWLDHSRFCDALGAKLLNASGRKKTPYPVSNPTYGLKSNRTIKYAITWGFGDGARHPYCPCDDHCG